MKKNKFIPLLFIFVIMIYSLLNNYNARFIDSLYYNYFYKELIFYTAGIILMILIYKTRLSKINKYHYFFYFVSVLFLVLVLFFGKEVNGAKAWFDFSFISFQPSELMKLTLAITLSKLTVDFNKKQNKNNLAFISKISILTIIPCFLVFIEPDTGAVIFYLLIFLTAYFSANIKKIWKVFLIIFSILIISSVILIYLYNSEFLTDALGPSIFYRIDRLLNYKDNYQINNAMTLIGSTNFFGAESSLYLHLPEAPTDFMYAYNFYNYGLFGCLFVTISYLFLCLTTFIETKKTKNNILKKMFVSVLFFGVIYNILMNLGLLPIMGIALPFLSYGGSSLIIYFMFLGLYLKD